MHWIDTTITLDCNNFTKEAINHEMFVEAKVFRLGEIAKDLCKNVTELEAQVTPSTPPEALEERRQTTTEAVKKIKEAEELCAKVVKKVS